MKERFMRLFYKVMGFVCVSAVIPTASVGIVATLLSELCERATKIMNTAEANYKRQLYMMDICDTEARTM